MIETSEMRLPFAYTLRGFPHRARIWREVAVIEMVAVSVRSIVANEAPIAVRWSLDGSRTPGTISKARAFDGKLYRPIEAEGARSISAERFQSAMEEMSRPGGFARHRYRFERNMSRSPMLAAYGGRPHATSRRSALDIIQSRTDPARGEVDDRLDCLAAAMGFYSEALLLIDGMVWTAVQAEPSWRVEPGSRVHLGTLPVDTSELAFPADRLDTALAAAYACGEPGQASVVFPVGYVEVLRPDLLSDDTVLLCKAMLDTFRYCSHFLGTYAEDAYLWSGFPKRVRVLRDLLSGLSRQHRLDLDEAFLAFRLADELMTLMESQGPEQMMTARLVHQLKPALAYFSTHDAEGRDGMSAEEANFIATAFD